MYPQADVSRLLCALGPDTAGWAIARLLSGDGATSERIDAAVYEVGPGWAWAFVRAARRGAKVRLVVDAHAEGNAWAVPILSGPVQVRAAGGRRGEELHLKLIVAGDRVGVGTGNLIERDAPHNPWPPDRRRPPRPGTREWWLVVDGDPGLVEAARGVVAAAFDAALPAERAIPAAAAAEAAPPVRVPPALLPPLEVDAASRALRLLPGGAAIRAELAARFAAASTRALVTVPYVHTGTAAAADLLAALQAASGRGAEVRLLLGTVPAPDAAAALAATGLAIRVMDPRWSTTGHAKGAVVDGAVVAGSANWSAAGLGGNLEAAIVADAPAAADYYAAAIAADWATAAPLRVSGRRGPGSLVATEPPGPIAEP